MSTSLLTDWLRLTEIDAGLTTELWCYFLLTNAPLLCYISETIRCGMILLSREINLEVQGCNIMV